MAATAKANAKFKPARARCSRLKIGDWSYTAPSGSLKTDFEAKFLFSRKRLVWEWKVDSSSKRKIEVAFASIEQIYTDNNNGQCKLFIVVKSAPTYYHGTILNNQPTKWGPTEDFTNGSIVKSSLHELDISSDTNLHVILQTLGEFAPNFREMMSRRAFASDSKYRTVASVIASEPAAKRFRSNPDPVINPASSAGLGHVVAAQPDLATHSKMLAVGCTCSGVCDPYQCGCFKALRQCSPRTCSCTKDCQNPLSLLTANGVPLDRLKSHLCLNDNMLYRPDCKPQRQLFTRIQLPCCKSETVLIHALATNVRCMCGSNWNFSFCRRTLINSNNPHCFHCPKCRLCQDIDAKHCNTCGVCSTRAKPCPCSKILPAAALKLTRGSIDEKFSPMSLFDDDGEHSLVVSPVLATDSPASVSSLSTRVPIVAKTSGISFSDLSFFSKAMLGLGQGPGFFQEVQGLLKNLYS